MKITADVTALAADMTTAWMQVEMVINAQNNKDAGANNNLGWNALGGQDVVRDGQPHTYTGEWGEWTGMNGDSLQLKEDTYPTQ